MERARVIPNQDDPPPPADWARTNGKHAVPGVETERALIAVALTWPHIVDKTPGLEPEHFAGVGHADIWRAIQAVHQAGTQPDFSTVADQLARDHTHVTGTQLTEFLAYDGISGNAAAYAQIILDHATTRAAITALDHAGQQIRSGVNPHDAISRIADRLPATPADPSRSRLINGAAFLLDQPEALPAIWGHGDTVLCAEGEATMIVGPTGIGKTTVAQQVVLGRLGLRGEVLGQPVTASTQRVLYLACDRPQQAARSMRRMVTEHDRDTLEECLIFWKGPPPFNIVEDPRALADYATNIGADTIVIDSLKDICHKLNDDEHASKTNAAIQEAIASGAEVIVLHHQRKTATGTKKDVAPKTIDDVYGNTWLTAGMGSVILIWGQPGDPIIELTHLKAPAEQAGPWTLTMDFDAGHTTIDEEISPLKIIHGSPRGATVKLVASILYKKEEPSRNELEKARRRLDKLATQQLVHREETTTDGGGKPTTLYYPTDTRHTP